MCREAPQRFDRFRFLLVVCANLGNGPSHGVVVNDEKKQSRRSISLSQTASGLNGVVVYLFEPVIPGSK